MYFEKEIYTNKYVLGAAAAAAAASSSVYTSILVKC